MKRYLFILLVILTASCTKDKNRPGYTYFPDMAYSPAYKTYSVNPVFEDGSTMRLPAEGTIPRGFKPYAYEPGSLEEQERAGKEIRNPLELTPEVLTEGKRQYEIFCMSCHGETGDGNGHLFTSRMFLAKPRSLVDDYLKEKPDGEIFHVITLGSASRLMGPHGGQIPPENRWKIVHYVRELAKNN
ncbi:c-type cytochrome [Gaoshiqia sp. Z1-71]|uniref:c-type cytochrome n=1 Tax=Gaoshiqia hydrogeniformans TaxID=3290090 RepID=UPI003BF7ACE4